MASSVRNMRLASVDDLFSTEETRQAEARQQGEQILTVPISGRHLFRTEKLSWNGNSELALYSGRSSVCRAGIPQV